jgi:GTPase SAR1 family protein
MYPKGSTGTSRVAAYNPPVHGNIGGKPLGERNGRDGGDQSAGQRSKSVMEKAGADKLNTQTTAYPPFQMPERKRTADNFGQRTENATQSTNRKPETADTNTQSFFRPLARTDGKTMDAYGAGQHPVRTDGKTMDAYGAGQHPVRTDGKTMDAYGAGQHPVRTDGKTKDAYGAGQHPVRTDGKTMDAYGAGQHPVRTDGKTMDAYGAGPVAPVIPHYRAVVIGKSGAGKTTFINMVANICQGRKYKEERLVAITQGFNLQAEDGGEIIPMVLKCNMGEFMNKQSDDVHGGQMRSQTQRCSEYTFETKEYRLTLVDTPGIGDTRGVDQDRMNAEKIAKQVASMGSFDVIILMYKGDDARKDLSVKYIISELQSMMPKDFKSNLIIAFSHVSNPSQIPGIKSLQEMGIEVTKIIAMNNDCYIPPDLFPAGGSEDADSKAMRMQIAENDWNRGIKQIGKLIDYIKNIQSGMQALDGKKMDNLRVSKIELGEKVARIMSLYSDRVRMVKDISEQEKELGYTRQAMDIENNRIEIIGKPREVQVKTTEVVEVMEERDYIVVWCKICKNYCEKLEYSKEGMNFLQTELNKNQNYRTICNFKHKEECRHLLSAHDLRIERYSVKVPKQKEVIRKEIHQDKQINQTAMKKKEELDMKIKNLSELIGSNKQKLQSLSTNIRSLMKEIITEHRAIVKESMLGPSDPLESILEMKILDLQEKADRNDPRAAQELVRIRAFLREYNEVKYEMDGKGAPVPKQTPSDQNQKVDSQTGRIASSSSTNPPTGK